MCNKWHVQQLSIKFQFQTHNFQTIIYVAKFFKQLSINCQFFLPPITISNNIFIWINFSINYQTIVYRNFDINPITNNIFYCIHYLSIINQLGISKYTIKPISINIFCFIIFLINYQSIIFYIFCYQTNIKQLLNQIENFNNYQ